MMWLLTVPLLAVVLLLAAALRGATVAKALQDRRYRRAEIASIQKAAHIDTTDLLRKAAMCTAQQDQELRRQQRTSDLNDWNYAFRNLCMGLDTDAGPGAGNGRPGPGPLPGSRATAGYHVVTTEDGRVGVQWPRTQW